MVPSLISTHRGDRHDESKACSQKPPTHDVCSGCGPLLEDAEPESPSLCPAEISVEAVCNIISIKCGGAEFGFTYPECLSYLRGGCLQLRQVRGGERLQARNKLPRRWLLRPALNNQKQRPFKAEEDPE